MKEIVLISSDTAGYATPNIALLLALREAGYEALYIGSYEGMERKLIEATNTPCCGISSGKLRHYFDQKNFTDPFRALKGYDEAKVILRDFRPDPIFSKDDCVAVSVVHAARRLGIPAVIHESDVMPGPANRLPYSVATKICYNFPETLPPLPKNKMVLTGSPIRAELLSGSREAAYERTGFTPEHPVFLVIGGSLGSRAVNASVREALPDPLKEFQVLHIAGKSSPDPTLSETPGYRRFEYASEELKDCFALADIMVSRAGTNAIRKILALRKSNVLIPLFTKASRGNQILNARPYEKQGYSHVLEEEALSRETLPVAAWGTRADRARYLATMEVGDSTDGVAQVMSVLNNVTTSRR